SRHPIFVTIGNIPTNLRNKPESKALVGLIPILESSKQIKETEEFLKAIRITFHKCFEILLAPIRVQHQTGIQLKVGNSYVWYTMVVAMILGDWPENGNIVEHMVDQNKLMKSWAKDFVLIGSYSNNQCQYPKLHHFLYYMISAIKDYGSPNGWNAETFEFLHKAYIKDPYCMSNKHNVNHQILGTVMRKLTLQEVYKTIFLNKPRHFYQSNEVILYKNYNNIPFRLIETTVNELKVREGPPEIIDGLEHFLEALSEYLKIMPDLNDEGNIIDMMETAIISLYESVRLTNGKFVRATLSYNNLPMFNDISIEIDESQLEEF
ncbi:hypothetical protein RhiirB3_455292, partial [Rhizophagus irregularis]